MTKCSLKSAVFEDVHRDKIHFVIYDKVYYKKIYKIMETKSYVYFSLPSIEVFID